MRVHAATGALVSAAAWLGGLPTQSILFVLSAVAAVIFAEIVNTAIESLVDLSTREFHPLAARCKDMAAGAVLVAALYAAVVGLVVFLPELPSVVGNLAAAVESRPLAVGLAAVVVAILWREALAGK
jgi:diacylglycerol kinase